MSFPVRVEGPQMKTILDERCVLMQVCFEIGTVKAHRSKTVSQPRVMDWWSSCILRVKSSEGHPGQTKKYTEASEARVRGTSQEM